MGMKRRRNRGIALLIVLLLVTLLTVLVAELVLMTGQQRLAADRTMADLQLTYALRAGYYRAVLYLQADGEEDPEAESAHEEWAKPLTFTLGDAEVLVEIQDAARGIDASKLVRDDGEASDRAVEILQRLGDLIGQDATVAERLVDYIDSDETGSYENGARNDLLFHPEEVLRVADVDRSVWLGAATEEGGREPGYLEFLTVWPRELASGSAGLRVNVNTAPREVLAALFDPANTSYADSMIVWRETPAPQPGEYQTFHTIADVQQAIGDATAAQSIQDVAAFTSSWFVIRVKARREGVDQAHVYVVQRDGQGKVELRTHYRLPEYLYAEEPE